MTRRILLGAAASALLYVVPATVHAAEPVLVAPALTRGDLADAIRARLEARLHEVVRKSDLQILEVSAKLEQRAAACEVDSCRADVIATSGAKFLLVPEITFDDQDYHLRLTLYAASGGKTAQLEETCSLCGLTEAVDVMADLGARIGRKVDVATRAADVEVVTDPPGAKVFVGHRLVGTTPLVLPLDAGAHSLRVELRGYIGLQRKLDVVAGESATLELALQAVPPKSGPDRGKLFTGIGWGALVSGVGVAVGGATLMAIDQRPITSVCSGTDVDVDGDCRWRHATLEGGIGLAVGGAVLIGAGVALILVARKHESKSPKTARAVRVAPSWAGFALRF